MAKGSRPGGTSRIFGSDQRAVDTNRRNMTFTFLKKNVRDANGNLSSLNDAIRNTKSTYEFYKGRVDAAPTFERYYKETSADSILYMTGKTSWDRATARRYYNSWLDSAKEIRNTARDALKQLTEEEKRRNKK